MHKQRSSYPFRPTEELRQKLEKSAEENRRSLNAEIISRLESSFLVEPSIGLDAKNNIMLKALCEKLGVSS